MKESWFGSQFKFDKSVNLLNYNWLPSRECFMEEDKQTGWEKKHTG